MNEEHGTTRAARTRRHHWTSARHRLAQATRETAFQPYIVPGILYSAWHPTHEDPSGEVGALRDLTRTALAGAPATNNVIGAWLRLQALSFQRLVSTRA